MGGFQNLGTLFFTLNNFINDITNELSFNSTMVAIHTPDKEKENLSNKQIDVVNEKRDLLSTAKKNVLPLNVSFDTSTATTLDDSSSYASISNFTPNTNKENGRPKTERETKWMERQFGILHESQKMQELTAKSNHNEYVKRDDVNKAMLSNIYSAVQSTPNAKMQKELHTAEKIATVEKKKRLEEKKKRMDLEKENAKLRQQMKAQGKAKKRDEQSKKVKDVADEAAAKRGEIARARGGMAH